MLFDRNGGEERKKLGEGSWKGCFNIFGWACVDVTTINEKPGAGIPNWVKRAHAPSRAR